MNLEILNLIVSIIGQIGIWITILLVFLTLKEMEKQRSESYKPVIVIPQFGLCAEGKDMNESILFESIYLGGIFDEAPKVIRGIDFEKPKLKRLAQVELYNLGAGAAKNISIMWELDFELFEVVNSIKGYFYKNSIPIIIDVNNENLEVNQNISPQGGFNYKCAIDPGENNIDYLLPQTVEISGVTLVLPIIYQKIITLFATCNKNKSVDWETQDLPLILNVRYQDIGNKFYENRYRLRITNHNWLTDFDTQITNFECLIKVTQIQ